MDTLTFQTDLGVTFHIRLEPGRDLPWIAYVVSPAESPPVVEGFAHCNLELVKLWCIEQINELGRQYLDQPTTGE